MNLESLIQTWGYPGLLVGALLEGETILVMAGYAAHRGYLELPKVIVVAFVGSTMGDQLWFLVGRRGGARFVESRPRWRVPAARIREMLDRHAVLICLGFRFLYGLRSVTPVVIGAAGFRTSRFVLLNLIGALVWSIVVGCAGYLCGHAIETLIGDVEKYELWLLLALTVIGSIAWFAHRLRLRFVSRGGP